MSYILDGSGVDSPECRSLEIQSVESVERASGVSGTLLFDAVDAFIEHEGPEKNYMPYLTILGRPAGIQADLPYNVTTLRYQSSHDKKLMTYRYDLTRENLAHMAMDGLFEEGFQPSHLARTSRYELPCEVSYVAFPPDEKLLDPETGNPMPPVVFASLQPGSLHCTDYESGYTIHDYFDRVPEPEPEAAREAAPYELPAAARVLGDEFSFAFGERSEPVVETAPEPGTEESGPVDASQHGEADVPVLPEVDIPEAKPRVPDASWLVRSEAMATSRHSPAARPQRPHDVSDMSVSGGPREQDVESEFI